MVLSEEKRLEEQAKKKALQEVQVRIRLSSLFSLKKAERSEAKSAKRSFASKIVKS